jgi:hypothetical protein
MQELWSALEGPLAGSQDNMEEMISSQCSWEGHLSLWHGMGKELMILGTAMWKAYIGTRSLPRNWEHCLVMYRQEDQAKTDGSSQLNKSYWSTPSATWVNGIKPQRTCLRESIKRSMAIFPTPGLKESGESTSNSQIGSQAKHVQSRYQWNSLRKVRGVWRMPLDCPGTNKWSIASSFQNNIGILQLQTRGAM